MTNFLMFLATMGVLFSGDSLMVLSTLWLTKWTLKNWGWK